MQIATLKRTYWQLTALLMAAWFAGFSPGLGLAMALTLWQAAHLGWLRRRAWTLEVQIRVFYFGLLILGSLPYGWPIHVMMFIGLNALVVFDYCLLGRMLAFAPWNRQVPLTMALVRKVMLSPPFKGSVLAWVQREDAAPPAAPPVAKPTGFESDRAPVSP